MSRSASLATVAALLLGAISTVRAQTYVGGVICADTTWDLAGSPYIVTVDAGGPIVVGCDATLTIDPGVEVRFEPAQALLVGWSAWGPGTLVARGTEQSPILFTSDRPAPAPGDWGPIDFLDQAADATFDGKGNYQSGCILEHVTVEYAGSSDYAALNVDQSAPYLSYCEVRDNLERGIAVYSAPPLRIENCHVHDNLAGGLYFSSSPGNELTANTITGNGNYTRYVDGGGIFFRDSSNNTLTANTISRNTAGTNGGGIYFDRAGSNTLTGNNIQENLAYRGAGIYFDRVDSNTLTGNMISGNSADTAGGIYFDSSSYNTLTGNIISGNTAGHDAGGVYFYYSHYNALTDNAITDNWSATTDGGGIFLQDSMSNTLIGNTISGNHAGFIGGGILLWGGSSNTLTANTISGNSAEVTGAGICLGGSSNTLTDNTITDNSAYVGVGGGICLGGTNNTLTANTISGNSAGYVAGGIYLGSSGGNTLTGNLIEDNTADTEGGAMYFSDSDNNTFAGNAIRFNHTATGLTGGIYVTDGSEWLSLNGGPEAYNVICCNDGYDVYNDNTFYGGDDRHNIDARNVYWCTDETAVIQAHIYDFFDDASRAMVISNPYVWSPPAGDLNCDGGINALDIEPFLVALFDPERYPTQYPDCDINNGDINGDCSINALDIEPFLNLLFQ